MGFFDSDGNPVEAVSKEEFETLRQEKETELQGAKDELEKFKNKDMNFSNLRNQKDEAEKKIGQAEQKLQEMQDQFNIKIEETKKEVFEGVLKDHYNETLDNMSNGDKDIKVKIEAQYARLLDTATTKAEITKKLTDAWSLAQDRPSNPVINAFATIPSASVSTSKSKKSLPSEARDVLQEMAQIGGFVINDEDIQKYA